jgi:DNA-binding HxlR family transcriptional regulator
MLQVVAALLDGPLRFGDLSAAVPGIAPNVLTDRLRRLERDRLVVAQAYSERPPRYVYELAEGGRELAGALGQLADWGARRAGGDEADAPRHDVCGTPLETVWWCPTCERPVAGGDADELHYA